jgi:hypothetical protein
MLREFHRVSRRWVIIDYRHCYSFPLRAHAHVRRMGIGRPPLSRVSRKELERVRRRGLCDPQGDPLSAPLLSDKWIVLAERPSGRIQQTRSAEVFHAARMRAKAYPVQAARTSSAPIDVCLVGEGAEVFRAHGPPNPSVTTFERARSAAMNHRGQ